MSDTSDAALDSWINWLEDLPLPKDFDEGVTGLQGFITAMRNKVAQLEMAAKSSGKVIVDMAGLPTPSAEFMAAMMPAFEAIAVQEMQKQVDELEAERDAAREAAIANAEFVDLVVKFKNERDAALARESAAYARGVQAALHEFDTGTEWMEIRDAIRALADAPPAPQCCMCGKKGLSTVEDDGGTECGLDDGRWVCSADCYDRAYPDAPPVVGVGVKPLVREELENIEKQLHVNEGYFDGSQRTTLEILQGHIKDSVSRIRAALEGDA